MDNKIIIRYGELVKLNGLYLTLVYLKGYCTVIYINSGIFHILVNAQYIYLP